MDKPKYINSLLDIDQFSGVPKKRMGPLLGFLFISGIPALIWMYWLMPIVPFRVFLVVQALWTVRMGLIILGEENLRVESYIAKQEDAYKTTHELLGIRKISDKGLIEYFNGEIAYIVKAESGNRESTLVHAKKVASLLDRLSNAYVVDIYVLNTSIGQVLTSRFSRITAFSDSEVMKHFVKFIDYLIEVANSRSYLCTTYFVFRCHRSYYTQFTEDMTALCNSQEASAFKSLEVADRDGVQQALSEDLGIPVDYEVLMMEKYATGDYDGSRVVAYDYHLKVPEEIIEDMEEEEVGFINEQED